MHVEGEARRLGPPVIYCYYGCDLCSGTVEDAGKIACSVVGQIQEQLAAVSSKSDLNRAVKWFLHSGGSCQLA
jgi:hypothetical protein